MESASKLFIGRVFDWISKPKQSRAQINSTKSVVASIRNSQSLDSEKQDPAQLKNAVDLEMQYRNHLANSTA